MNKLIEKLENILVLCTDEITKFLKKVFISDTERLLKFIISILLVIVLAYVLRAPFYLLELIGSSVFGLIPSNFVAKLFTGMWLVLLIVLYLLAIFYLFCLVAKRYIDKPKEKEVNNILKRIYYYYPTVVKIVLGLVYIWLILHLITLFICIFIFGSFVWNGVHVPGLTMICCGLFLILLYIVDVLYSVIKKVGVRREK